MAEATPRPSELPWKGRDDIGVIFDNNGDPIQLCGNAYEDDSEREGYDNYRYILTAVNERDALLARVERLERGLDAISRFGVKAERRMTNADVQYLREVAAQTLEQARAALEDTDNARDS